MAGFDLKEGRYEVRNASDDELWSAFACVFSSKSRNDSSYKYGFLKAIIDNLYNVDKDLKLTFDQLFSKFGEIYWNLILKHSLRQKAATNDNETDFSVDVGMIISQLEIYDQIWFVRHMPKKGEHSREAKKLVAEIVSRLENIPDGGAESFPFELIDELKEEYLSD